MKTLYIHGLDSHPVPEKLDILEKAGLEVVALHINYRTENKAYHILKKYAEEQAVEFLVGSSLGGYIAYWLAQDLGLPCLLFNPAMSYRDSLDEHLPEIINRLCPARFVVIGAFDDIVEPEDSINYFRDQDDGECYQRVLVCEWLEHQIDFNSFEELLCWALKSFKLYLKNQR
ncbi:MAG: hypothetical protein K9H16_09940 [Bacteroidales bacterium]|nr:hypothetical protein [Bacteroidales bacterium]